MTLGWWFILIAILALAAAVWLQFRDLEGGAGAFARRRRRSAIALSALVGALGVTHALATGAWQPRLVVPKEDGGWRAVSIDGKAVGDRQFLLDIKDREVAGGRDDCNDWGYSDEPPEPGGGRMVISTLVGCEEDDPLREVYRRIAHARDLAMDLRPDGTLRLAGGGHEAYWRRCTWVSDMASSLRLCVMDG